MLRNESPNRKILIAWEAFSRFKNKTNKPTNKNWRFLPTRGRLNDKTRLFYSETNFILVFVNQYTRCNFIKEHGQTFNSYLFLKNYSRQEDSITIQSNYWPLDLSTSPMAKIIAAWVKTRRNQPLQFLPTGHTAF